MLISRISDENEGAGEGNGAEVERVSSQEYQTASELFDLMTKNRHFEGNDDDSLTTQDVVLLYKNIDIGTRLMSDATNVRRRKPNQYVETVVYNDGPESDSDLSENLSADDLQNVFKINQERLNLFDNGSFDNILCHKLGGLEIKSSDLTTDYNRQFLFKDPYIKEQLKSLNVMASCSDFENFFPTSLLDYICCKRLEDNYNFYMDNIIKYVQHTIEQLKRISNGDYLTDRAKEKWEEIKKNEGHENSNTKVLATSTSIPLHVQCKKRGNATWDDIVHSEVDVRSLSKILEKKIVVEIPKLICGSYRLFSKRCDDNLIISCKREKEDEESRVDVVLKLERSKTGQVISNISSIMILQTTPAVQDLRLPEMLPITYKNSNDKTLVANDDSKENTITITDCTNDDFINAEMDTTAVVEEVVTEVFEDSESLNDESNYETNDYPFSETECVVSYDITSNQYSSESSVALRDILVDQFSTFPNRNEATFLVSPDELRVSMQKLNMQSSLPEESEEDMSVNPSSKKKSPARVRIKSPYENQSYILEEKKRKRLLEIREKREKKKMALGENAKVSKHKYGKGAVTPQASNSVTKLSITNKSFYNSIYGQSLNDSKSKTKIRKGLKKDSLLFDVPIDQIQEEYCESPNLTPEKNSKKYINRSYYLDETETEVMYMDMKQDVRTTCSASPSAISNELSENLNLLSQLIGPSKIDINKEKTVKIELNQSLDDDIYNNSKDAGCSNEIPLAEIHVPVNSPKVIVCELDDHNESKKLLVTVECRKSIDKLYDLMKRLGKKSATDLKTSKSKLNVRTVEKFDAITGCSTIQASDSGTSLKHQLTSSNPSCFSFGKMNAENSKTRTAAKKERAATVVPKVIISSKLQTAKLETDKLKKDRKKIIISPSVKNVPENPLKAISQLLHEFDNVQKTRQKNIPEVKPPKKIEMVAGDGKPVMSRQNSFRRRSRLDQHLKENDPDKKVTITSPKEKRSKPLTPTEFAKIPNQLTVSEDKHVDKVTKKKIADIIDEAKEARGEAVRGPSKLNSRLQSLAQPKKSYVQAHSEEYQHKYGKNLMADRLQRLAAAGTSQPPVSEPIVRNVSSPTARNRMRREATSSMSVKHSPPSVQPIDKSGRDRRRSVSSSPNRKSPPPTTQRHDDSEVVDCVKKMGAVESYVKSHYGLGSPPRSELLLAGHKSRLPLLPSDIELASMTSSPAAAEEANELGKKLHRIIDSIVVSVPPLTSLTECQETISKISRENIDDISIDDFRDQRTDSDYNIDILEDKNLETAVESHSSNKREDSIDDIFGIPDTLNHELKPFNSTTELEILENALYNQISGAFQKRLRLKNLTLTPKQSVQQVFLLQSGDAGSVLVKSTASSLKIKCDESLHDLKSVPVLSNSHLNWNFAQFPMQIATVGYALPIYQPDCGTKLDLKSLSGSRTAVSEHGSMNSKSDKVSQCFKGVHQELKTEQAAQVYIEEITATSEIIDDSEQIVTKKKSEEHVNLPTATETPKVIDDILPNISEEDLRTNESSIDKQVPPPSPDHVGYTTSLDMLVGLLNEIQKITCQNPAKDQSQCTDLEAILCNAAALENDRPRDLVSLTSLDKLRQLESNPSIYSFYISSEGSPSNGCIVSESAVNKPIFVDKEVNVNLSEKEVVNTFTDVPSLLPILVNHSTNVTNSLIGVISEPSTQSMLSITDYHTLYSNTFFSSQSIKKIIELPQVESHEKLKESKKTDLNAECCEIASPTFEIERLPEHKCSVVVNRIKKHPVKMVDFESGIKIKRDILVTVYSILVFTVFVALSLPDMVFFDGNV